MRGLLELDGCSDFIGVVEPSTGTEDCSELLEVFKVGGIDDFEGSNEGWILVPASGIFEDEVMASDEVLELCLVILGFETVDSILSFEVSAREDDFVGLEDLELKIV